MSLDVLAPLWDALVNPSVACLPPPAAIPLSPGIAGDNSRGTLGKQKDQRHYFLHAGFCFSGNAAARIDFRRMTSERPFRMVRLQERFALSPRLFSKTTEMTCLVNLRLDS
ncbi:hypothetical protein E2C01_060911 [Portunus trituberculatus]|uniref:Uncharacterized protein n=1 Tax=Portunus trituberculatus TaxID=210409 RepID=A0A5B7HCY4_PORTR|nr:hypothetical protein [Portunus trituberculatus]